MARFADALKSHPAPSRLGDVTLRYEPSMLIGETEKPRRSALPSFAWLAGFSLLLFAVAALMFVEGVWLAVVLMVLGAMSLTAAVRLERHEKRQRRFVANFLTYSLRLDFTSPIAGYARTIVVPFDDVKELALIDQTDGERVLVVDFMHRGARLREALVAFISSAQRDEAERVERVLHGAFGLGEVPADSPLHDAEVSSFE